MFSPNASALWQYCIAGGFVVETDRRHKGEVVRSSRISLKESAVELTSVGHQSVSDDDSWSRHSSLPSNDDDSSCARTYYVLPVDRWLGKRKHRDDMDGSKHMKSSKPSWVEGLGHSADNRISMSLSALQTLGALSPTKSTASSSTASSPVKHTNKSAPATKALPPPSQLSPVLPLISRKCSSYDANVGVKTHPPDADSGYKTLLTVTDSSSKTCLSSAESLTKTRPSASTDSGDSTKTHPSPGMTMSPTSAAVSSIVGMSLPGTPVMLDPHATSGHRQSKQKGRGRRDPNSLPCKGDRISDYVWLYLCHLLYFTSCWQIPNQAS